MAQNYPNFWVTFVIKVATTNFNKFAQSGHTVHNREDCKYARQEARPPSSATNFIKQVTTVFYGSTVLVPSKLFLLRLYSLKLQS